MMRRIALALALFAAPLARAESVCDEVDPFIGTEGGGNTYPGAQVPWGMVSVSPHTDLDNPSGYSHGRKHLYGLGHVHLSGVGCADLGNILLMATIGPGGVEREKFKSQFANEQASPGYFRADLTTWGVTLEATATTRVGLTRVTFPARPNGDANILLDVSHRLQADRPGAATPYLGSVWIVSATEIAGWSESGGFCGTDNRQKVYFTAAFSKPAGSIKPWYEGAILNGSDVTGKRVGMLLNFVTTKSESVMVKVGVSYVSVTNARANLYAEMPGWEFAATRRGARAEWEKELSRVKVDGGSATQRRIFRTALYHMLFHPNVSSDVNGDYQGFRGSGPRKADGWTQYSVYSLWDTWRTLHPFLNLAYPARQLDMVRSMIEMYRDGGWLPKWELAGQETYVMVGDPAAIVVAESALKGLKGLDREAAWVAVRKGAMETPNPLRPGFDSLLKLGYIPEGGRDGVWGTVSTALEYAVADWHAGTLAKALDKTADADALLARSRNWRNLFDPATGFLRAKNNDGSWAGPFDPAANTDGSGGPGYVEGNAWQYAFFVQHNVPGLMALHGNSDIFTDKLQECFDTGNYIMWNEPDFAWPYLFDFADGEAWRTQRYVHEALGQYVRAAPNGIPGNDDAGTTSGWIVWSMLGLYPVCPGANEYEIGTPAFEKVAIALDPAFWPGKTFTITASPVSAANHFIQGATLNGRPHNTPHIRFEDVVKGAILAFDMGPQRSVWGGTPRTPVIYQQPVNSTTVEGWLARFSVRAGGTGPVEYQWRRNDQDIPGAVRRELDIPTAPLDANGSVFTCVVHNPFGRVESKGATLFVEADRKPPEATSAIIAPPGPGNALPVVTASFSKPVERGSAENPANYRIYPTVPIQGLEQSRDGRSVAIKLGAAPDPDKTTRIDISGVRDRSTAHNLMAPTRLTLFPEGDGLAAEYFPTIDLKGTPIRRVDSEVNFNWGNGPPEPAIPPDRFSARWKGKVRPEESGVWTFCTFTDDGVRLWVDGKKLVDEWHDMQPAEHSGTLLLESGKLYEIWLEYFENAVDARCDLRWSGPTTPKSIVPRKNLYSK